MEVSSIEKLSKKKGAPLTTAKVSLGRQFEEKTAEYLEKKGWTVLASNLRFKVGEVDLFAYDPSKKRHVVVEVRSVRNSKFLPSRTVSPWKIRRLKTLANLLQQKKKTSVHLLFIEVVANGSRVIFREYPIENY